MSGGFYGPIALELVMEKMGFLFRPVKQASCVYGGMDGEIEGAMDGQGWVFVSLGGIVPARLGVSVLGQPTAPVL